MAKLSKSFIQVVVLIVLSQTGLAQIAEPKIETPRRAEGCGAKVVEQVPLFPGCDTAGLSQQAKILCAQRCMLEFIYSRLQYPDTSWANTENFGSLRPYGSAVVSFRVETDGSLSKHRIIRDPFPGAGEEAMRIVKLFPRWIPASHRGELVAHTYNLPVKFARAVSSKD